MNGNGLELDHLRQLIEHQHQRDLELTTRVTETMQAPQRTVTITVCAITYEPASKVLMIAQPTGERIDVPLTDDSIRYLRRSLDELVDGEPGG